MNKKNFAASMCLAVLTLNGCANVKSFSEAMRSVAGNNLMFVEPPESKELQPVNALALNQSGPGAAVLTEMQKQLGSAKIGNEPYYKSVIIGSPQNGDKLNWGDVNVTVTMSPVRDARTQEVRFRCPGTKVVNKCKSEEAIQYQVVCQSRTISGEANLSAKDVSKNRILLTRYASKNAESKVCSDESNSSVDTAEALQQRLSQDMARSLVAGLTPTYVKRPIDLVEDAKTLNEADNTKLASYYKLAAKGSLDGACKGYQEMLEQAPNNGVLLFNLGYCNHAKGNFAQAKQLYTRAAQSGNAPVELLAKYSAETDDWLGQGINKVGK